MKNTYFILFFCFTQLVLAQVGINTASPKSMLDINGNISVKEVGIVNSYVSGSAILYGGPGGNAKPINDGIYISLTPTTGNVEFILPNAASIPGRIYFLRNISDTETAKIFSFGGQFYPSNSINPITFPLNMPPNALLKSVIFISDGTNWTYFF